MTTSGDELETVMAELSNRFPEHRSIVIAFHQAWQAWKSEQAEMSMAALASNSNEATTDRRVAELSIWVRRLAHALQKAAPHNALSREALEALKHLGALNT